MIGEENAEEFQRLRADVEAYFEPIGSIEQELVCRLAGLLWRLRRIPLMEAAVIRSEIEQVEQIERAAHGRSTFAVGNLWEKLDAMAARMRGAGDEDCKEPVGKQESEKEELRSLSKTQSPANQEIPPEVRRKHVETALASAVCENKIGHLPRYEAFLTNAVNRTIALLQFLQSSRGGREADGLVIGPPAVSHLQRTFKKNSLKRR